MKSLMLLFICFFISSCHEYYFSEPQPIFEKNITKVPNKLRGTWTINNSDENEGIDSFIIGKSFFWRFSMGKIKESMMLLELDTSAYIIGDKVYYKGADGLEGGYHFTTEGDSVVLDMMDVELVDLGQGAFLRKIDYGYILNIHHDKMPEWWTLKFIDTRPKEAFLVRGLSGGDLDMTDRYRFLHEDLKNYILASWNKSEVEAFINKGGFSDTLFVFSYADRKSY